MSSKSRRLVLRSSAVLGVVTAGALATAGTAFAHVTAQPGTAEQGGYTVVNFRVPDESDTAGTIKLVVTLPSDKPFASVRTAPIPGWTATLTTTALNPPVQIDGGRSLSQAVTAVTWTAAPGNKIAPGQYLDFPLSLGPMPKNVTSVTMPAVQTYDNGDVVSWDQATVAGQAEPEHPAPVVKLTPSTGDDDHAAMAMGSGAPESSDPGGSDTTARWLGGAGLLVGALGLGVGGGALMRSKKKSDVSS
jgi:periplasmic copper chaperone A